MDKKAPSGNPSASRANPLPGCPMAAAFAAVSSRWKLTLLYWLAHGECHFAGLRRRAAPITAKVLAEQLRGSRGRRAGRADRHRPRPGPGRLPADSLRDHRAARGRERSGLGRGPPGAHAGAACARGRDVLRPRGGVESGGSRPARRDLARRGRGACSIFATRREPARPSRSPGRSAWCSASPCRSPAPGPARRAPRGRGTPSGSRPRTTTELGAEQPQARESHLEAHVGHRQRAGPEQRLGPLHPAAEQVAVRGLPEGRLERPREVRLRHVGRAPAGAGSPSGPAYARSIRSAHPAAGGATAGWRGAEPVMSRACRRPVGSGCCKRG